MDKLEDALKEEDKAIGDLEIQLAERRRNKLRLLAENQQTSGKPRFVSNVQRKLQTTTQLLQLLKRSTMGASRSPRTRIMGENASILSRYKTTTQRWDPWWGMLSLLRYILVILGL